MPFLKFHSFYLLPRDLRLPKAPGALRAPGTGILKYKQYYIKKKTSRLYRNRVKKATPARSAEVALLNITLEIVVYISENISNWRFMNFLNFYPVIENHGDKIAKMQMM